MLFMIVCNFFSSRFCHNPSRNGQLTASITKQDMVSLESECLPVGLYFSSGEGAEMGKAVHSY